MRMLVIAIPLQSKVKDTVSNQINSVALGKSSQATGGSATALGPQARQLALFAVAMVSIQRLIKAVPLLLDRAV